MLTSLVSHAGYAHRVMTSAISFSDPGTYPTSTLKWLRSSCQRACRPVGPVGFAIVSFAHSSKLLWSDNTTTCCKPIHDAHFLSASIIAYASFSLMGQLLACPGVSFRLINATGTVFLCNESSAVTGSVVLGSCSKTAPTAFSDASTRSTNGALGLTAFSDKPETRAVFNCWKASRSSGESSMGCFDPFFPNTLPTFNFSINGAARAAKFRT